MRSRTFALLRETTADGFVIKRNTEAACNDEYVMNGLSVRIL